MSKLIHRITMFKLPAADEQAQLLAAYEKLAKQQSKDGKPYIPYICAGLTNPDDTARSQGFTVVAQSKFRSLDDMKFYDEQCAAHMEVKTLLKEKLKPEGRPVALYFEGAPLVDEIHT